MIVLNAYCSKAAAHRGFTFVELMMTLAIAGILVVTAVPNFASALRNQGVKATAFNVVSALSYARSEAIKRNRPVTLRAVNGDWRQVWFVCAPDSTATTTEQGRCDAGEIELRDWIHPDRLTISASTTVGGTLTVQSVTFRSDGRVTTGVLFDLCDDSASAAVTRRMIRLDASGRANLKYWGTCGSSA